MIGYIAVCQPIKAKDRAAEPLSYGLDESDLEPHNRLLMRGKKATVFRSLDDAVVAVNKTIADAEADGHPWPKTKRIFLIQLHEAD